MSDDKSIDQTFLSELTDGLREAVVAVTEREIDHVAESRAFVAARALSANDRISPVATDSRVRQPVHDVRKRSLVRWAVAATILLGFLALLGVTSDGASRAFAQVQQAVAELSSVSFRATHVDDESLSQQILLSGQSRGRVEFEDGRIFIFDLSREKSVFLDPNHQTAVVSHGLTSKSERVFFEILRGIRSGTVRKVQPMDHDGMSCPGYRYFDGKFFIRLWVNPGTMLPVYAEGRLRDATDSNPTFRIDQFQFNVTTNAADFEVVAPASYTVTQYTLPDSVSTNSQRLTLMPLKGLGPVEFGMTKDEIIKAIGKPDAIGPIKQTGGALLHYDSQGFWLSLNKHGRMTDVQCHVNNEDLDPAAVTFDGITDKGITMKASAAEVIRAYGQPDADRTSDRNSSIRTVAYYKLGLNFTLKDDQLEEITAFLPSAPERKTREMP